MKQRVFFVLIATLLPAAAAAQDEGKYQCTYGDMQRRVEIVTEPGMEVPCSVHYFKDTEAPGEQQVLWSAENDGSYCRSKAMEFVAKLEGWGWNCGRGVDNAPEKDVADESAPAETDEMLGTAEDEQERSPD